MGARGRLLSVREARVPLEGHLLTKEFRHQPTRHQKVGFSASGGRAIDITAQLQQTAGCYLTAVVVLLVLENLRLQQGVLSALDTGKLAVRH